MIARNEVTQDIRESFDKKYLLVGLGYLGFNFLSFGVLYVLMSSNADAQSELVQQMLSGMTIMAFVAAFICLGALVFGLRRMRKPQNDN